MLEPRMGKLVHGKLEGGHLYTQAYVARLRAMIRGAVRALMVPTNLPGVWSCLQQLLSELEGNSSAVLIGEGKLFQTLFNGLLKEGALSGSLQAGGSVWTPSLFEKVQHEGVEAFFSQNSYVNYDMLRKLAVSRPKQFLQGKYVDGIALETLFVHPSFISMVDAAVEEAVEGGGWIDCVSLVPSSFSPVDIAKMLSLCPYVQKAEKESKSITLGETYIVSTSFLKVVLEKLECEVKNLASSAISKANNSSTKNGVLMFAAISGDVKDVNMKGSTSQGKVNKRKGTIMASAKATVPEDGEDDISSVKGPKGKKKGGKSKSNSSLGTLSNKSGKGNPDRLNAKEDDLLSEDFIANRVVETFPELEDAGIGDDGVGMLVRSIAVHIRPALLSTWEAAKQVSISAATEKRRNRADALQKKVDDLYASLQLFAKSVDLFDDDPVTLTALHRHLLRTTASNLADVIIKSQELERRLENGDIADEAWFYNSEPLNASERLSMAKNLEGTLSMKCVKMVETLESKVIDEFEVALQTVAEECGLRLKKLDKKTEKILVSTYSKVHNKALQAPGRTIASAINHLKKVIPENLYATLMEYQSVTVALLSMLSTSVPGGPDCTSDRMLGQRERLAEMMPRLKEIVLNREYLTV
ncbi:hypothetical protein KP509_36G053900 [Ceratopteris richardii]|uniref:E3 UFM1-protein ligase 1 homolog n=2 Tax=Ceratopteris richardii TaxID=49495 RepID=A0A8T2QBR9_CERRI|nr:hypothetical protein KP509_36G053900 [Ceratopteris richardii]